MNSLLMTSPLQKNVTYSKNSNNGHSLVRQVPVLLRHFQNISFVSFSFGNDEKSKKEICSKLW